MEENMFDDANPAYTPISHFGEFGLIEHLTQHFPIKNAAVVKGVGDDAAVIQHEAKGVTVVSTDLLLEGVHFDLSYVPLRHLGYKAVVVNLSDIYAMNAQPIGITVSLGMSNRFTVEAMEELYAGVQLACEKYGVDLLGGDTSSSKQGLMLSVTAMGTSQAEKVAYRSGAKANDLICVTGDLGAAYAGFLVLEREKAEFLHNPHLQPDLSDYDYVVGRQLKPETQPKLIQLLKEGNIQPTSMMDISDGLASELHHICRQSKCGCTIYADKLPIDFQTVAVADEFQISAVTFALNGGEDYELLFTVDIADFQKVKDLPNVTIIGHITGDEKKLDIVLAPGNMVEIEAQGWQHFK
ncbi:MAG: thiamine-phosphate kinase [Bacteroidia bacterium]